VFVISVLMVVLGLAMVVAGILVPVDAARLGLVLGGLAVAASGLFTGYLNAPARRRAAPPGMTTAKARILAGTIQPGSVSGFQMVELDLEVRPKDGTPFQVKRQFSSLRLGRVEPGRELDVVYDPVDPEKVELA
jgi:hypothetical protein